MTTMPNVRWFPTACALSLMTFAAGPAHGQAPPPLRLERKIELPDVQGRIDHLSVDPKTGRLFVAALGNDTLEVVDIEGGKRVGTLRGLAEPQGVLFVADAQRVFVANGKDGSLRIFDAASLAPVQRIDLGDDADNVRLDRATGRVWVAYGDGALAAVDAKGAKVEDVPLGGHPESFQLETNGPRIFVNVPRLRKVAVVDRVKRAVVASWPTGDAAANFPMALDERGKRLFVVCRTPARLLALDTDSGAIVATAPTVGDSDDVFYDAAARRVYVSGGEGAVAVYQQAEADRYPEVARIATTKGARTSLFSPDLGRLLVAARREGTSPAAIWVYAVAK
jgi:DNA-binding beta-propeller fold protein YncE